MAQSLSATIRTTGMHCQSCAMLIQMSVEDLPGIETVKVDAAAGTTDVTFDPDIVGVDKIAEAIKAAGYGVEV
ncbi:MAG TPA: heavy-metal-associated domain-containing protein [Coriobacteriia bacterium]